MSPVIVESPDHAKSVVLEYDGEARFGPAFFRARGSGFIWPLSSCAIIGEDIHWSEDSRYVVVLVLLSRNESLSPVVQLLAIDTHTSDTIEIDRNSGGLIYPIGFLADRTYHYKRSVEGTAQDALWMRP